MRSMLPAGKNNNAGPLHKPVWRLLFISTKSVFSNLAPSWLIVRYREQARDDVLGLAIAIAGKPCAYRVVGASVWGRSWTPR